MVSPVMVSALSRMVVLLGGRSIHVVCSKEATHSMTGLFVLLRAPTDTNAKLVAAAGPPDGDDPLSHFICTIVDPNGYLQPVHNRNPWHELLGPRTEVQKGKKKPQKNVPSKMRDAHLFPHLGSGAKFVACLVRHPDPAYARALTTWLNTGADLGNHKFDQLKKIRSAMEGEDTLGGRALVAREVTLEAADAKGLQLKLALDETPDCYLPADPDGWLLYANMPHARCSGVDSGVKKMQARLAALRYPAGGQESPYDATKSAEYGRFGDQTQLALGAFQEDARSKRAFKSESRERDFDWIIGAPAEGPDCHKMTLACYDVATRDAMTAWEEDKLRKPGRVLLPIGGKFWMREEAAVAVMAWRLLVQVFRGDPVESRTVEPSNAGSPASKNAVVTLPAGHSFRSIMASKGGGVGVAAASLHKTGIAVDFAVVGHETLKLVDFSSPAPNWPIHFEAHWHGGAATERVNWRLYDYSALDVFSKNRDAVLDGLHDALHGITDHARTIIAKKFSSAVADDAKRWLVAELSFLAKAETTLLRMLGETAVDVSGGRADLVWQLFRPEVYQWKYNPYSIRGGEAGPPITAAQREASTDFLDVKSNTKTTAPANGKSFVNVTVLGWYCGMLRINAQQKGGKGFRGSDHPPMQKLPMFSSDKRLFGFFVGLVDRLGRHSSSAKDASIVFWRGKTALTRSQSQFDHVFLKAWAQQLSEIRKPGKSERARVSAFDPQVQIELAADAKGKKEINEALEALLGPYSTKKFVLLEAGVATTLDGVGTISTGLDWKTRLLAASDAFPGDARRISRAHTHTDWCVRFQPVFESDDVDVHSVDDVGFQWNDTVEMPTPGVGRALEWWHYQHKLANGVTWGKLVAETGFSRELLFSPEVPPYREEATTFCGAAAGYPPTSDSTGHTTDPTMPENCHLEARLDLVDAVTGNPIPDVFVALEPGAGWEKAKPNGRVQCYFRDVSSRSVKIAGVVSLPREGRDEPEIYFVRGNTPITVQVYPVVAGSPDGTTTPRVEIVDRRALIDRIATSCGLIRRADWKAIPAKYGKLEDDWDFDAIVIHHSGPGGLLHAHSGPKDVEAEHLEKYDDVAYQYVIDRNGRIYEGRYLSKKSAANAGLNTHKIGILLIGDFMDAVADRHLAVASVEACNGKIEKVKELGSEVWAAANHEDPSRAQIEAATRLVKSLKSEFPTIVQLGGHRDWKVTTVCPGARLYAQLATIRQATGLLEPLSSH